VFLVLNLGYEMVTQSKTYLLQ